MFLSQLTFRVKLIRALSRKLFPFSSSKDIVHQPQRKQRWKSRYPAARCNPVADGKERKAQGHDQNHQTLDSYRLFPQAWEVLVPDCQELLLAIGVSHKLLVGTEREGEREVGYHAIVDSSATECMCILKILMHILFPDIGTGRFLVIFFTFPLFFKIAPELLQELKWKHEGKTDVVLNHSSFSLHLQTPLWNLGDVCFPLQKRVPCCCLPAYLHSVQNGKENSYLVYWLL